MESLFKHILVPLDFTQKDEAAIRYSLNLAKQNQAQVTLLHVIEMIDYTEDDEVRDFYETLKKRANEKLAVYGEKFDELETPVSLEIVMGKTAQSIVSFAMQNESDLVVLSSHKISLDQVPQSWATLSYQVSILCQCPVMLVK